MGLINFETLSKFSNIIQILILASLYFGAIFQTKKFIKDKKISRLRTDQIIEHGNRIQVLILVVLYIGAGLSTINFIINIKINGLAKERFSQIENRPGFNEGILEMMTGVPASIYKNAKEASDLYDKKDYLNAAKKSQVVIDDFERLPPINLKDYDEKTYKKYVSIFYGLSARANTYLHKYDIAYEHAKKANAINITHDTLYVLSVVAYNAKKYQISLDNINKAIEIKPSNSEPDIAVYLEIKERCLRHLNSEKNLK